MNLAQAALIVAYEWARADGRTALAAELYDAAPASKENFERLIVHLFEELESAGYFLVPKKRPTVERNIKVALTRAGMTEAEVRTLRGVIKALVNPRNRNDT